MAEKKSFSEPKKVGNAARSNDQRKSGGNTPFRRVKPEAVDDNMKISNRFTDWVIIFSFFSNSQLRMMMRTKTKRWRREMRTRLVLAGRTSRRTANPAGFVAAVVVGLVVHLGAKGEAPGAVAETEAVVAIGVVSGDVADMVAILSLASTAKRPVI